MKALFSILLLFSTVFSCVAQESEANYFLEYPFQKGDTCYIYSDIANVRDGASTNDNIVDKLKCSDRVEILEKDVEKADIVNGLSARWFKVKYKDKDQTKEGYLWSGNLSRRQLEIDDTKFYFGLDRVTDKGDFHQLEGQIKAVSKNKEIVSRKQYQAQAASFFEGYVLDEPKWNNGENKVIKIMIEGEACGIPYTNIFFVWDGKNLKYLSRTYSVGDLAYNNGYNHSERLIFPTSYNESDRMVIKYVIEDTGDYDPDYQVSTRVKTEIYHWDSNKLVLQNQNWKENDTF